MIHTVVVCIYSGLSPLTGFLVCITSYIFLQLVDILAGLDVLFFYVASPTLPLMATWFTGLLFIFMVSWSTAKKRILCALTGIFFVLVITQHLPQTVKGIFKITVLSTGGGESIIMEFPDGECVLLDGGGSHDERYDAGKRFLVPWLRRHGIHYLDYVILSHPHPDHMMGLFAVVRQIPVAEFWYGIHEQFVPPFNQLLETVAQKNIHIQSLGGGLSSAEFDPGMNNNSLVLRIVYGDFSILLAGDIEREAEETLAIYGSALQSTVLKAPHHGSTTSSTQTFLEQVHPDYIVISAAWNPYTKLPSPIILDRYAKLPWNPHVFSTDTHGNILLKTNGETISIRTDR